MSSYIIIDSIFYGFLGIILGILLSWAYVINKNANKDIEKIIDSAMIGSTILKLEDLSFDLVQLLSRISDCYEELNQQLINARDIELNLLSHYDLKKIKNIDTQVDDKEK